MTDNAIEKALESVPEDMDATYKRILNMISKKPRGQRELARKVLICIAYTRSPLPISILAYLVSIEYDTKTLEALETSTPSESVILSACSNLVSIDRKTQEVRFVHFSVQEFLTSDRSSSTLDIGHQLANMELARMSITLLSILNHQSLEACKQGTLLLSTLDNWPFYVLAAGLNFLPEDDPLVELILSFFDKNPPMIVQNRATSMFFKVTYLSFSPSVLALMFNLPSGYQEYQIQLSNGKTSSCNQLRNLYKHHRIIFNDYFAVHYITSVLDSVSAAQRLSAHGSCIDYFYNNDRVLAYERSGFNTEYYLRWDEIPSMYEYTPLYSARGGGMARFLLDKGASVEPHHIDSELVDPLRFFACRGNAKVTQLLLDRIVDQHGVRCGAVLCGVIGSRDCSVEVVRQLLDKGADVNAQGGKYGNALHAAASWGRLEVVQLFLAKGANVNAQGGEYGNALQAAALWGKLGVVQLLLDKGANVNAQGGEYGNALQAAAYGGHLEIAQLLLDKEANVNAQGGKYGNALNAAEYWGHSEMVQLLLAKGATVEL